MSNPAIAESQLLELLVQLKRTTPEAAKQILNSQPAIAYALITVMVSMNAINSEVFQKTLAAFGASQAQQAQAQPPAAVPPPLAAPVNHHQAPPALQQPYRQSATPSNAAYPPYSNGYPQNHQMPAQSSGYSSQSYSNYPSSSVHPTAPPASYQQNPQAPPPGVQEALAAIPDDQKAMIMRVMSMTPDQINQLPPAERASIIQLRTTLGIPG